MKQIWTTSIGKQQGIDLLNAHAQWYCNDIEPTTTYPFQNWADTGNDLWKQRNADDNGWIVRGRLSEAYFGLMQQSMIDIIDPLGVPKPYFGTVLPEFYLWCDGKTIGDGSSGATARANEDVHDLFVVLWSATELNIYDSTGVLSTRGASAEADWVSHKRVELPRLNGRTLIGCDNLGGTSANVVTNDSADIVGGKGGEEWHTLSITEIPSHTHKLHIVKSDPNRGLTTGSSTGFYYSESGVEYTFPTGEGNAHNNMQPWIACNWIMRY